MRIARVGRLSKPRKAKPSPAKFPRPSGKKVRPRLEVDGLSGRLSVADCDLPCAWRVAEPRRHAVAAASLLCVDECRRAVRIADGFQQGAFYRVFAACYRSVGRAVRLEYAPKPGGRIVDGCAEALRRDGPVGMEVFHDAAGESVLSVSCREHDNVSLVSFNCLGEGEEQFLERREPPAKQGGRERDVRRLSRVDLRPCGECERPVQNIPPFT